MEPTIEFYQSNVLDPAVKRRLTPAELEKFIPPAGTDLLTYIPKVQEQLCWSDFVLFTHIFFKRI